MTYGTGGFVGSAGSEVFGWSFSGKGSVWSVVVTEVLEGLDHLGDFVDADGEVGAGIELIAPGSIAAFDGPIELWRTRRKEVEGQVLVGAGQLELGHELGASIDLDGFDGNGHLPEDGVEELGGVFGGGPFARLGDGPFGDRIVGVEMLDGDAGQRIDRQGVDLDDVAGLFEGDGLGFSDGVGTFSWRCSGGDLADQGGNGLNRSATDERADDAPDGGVGCGVALFAQDGAELFLAPHRMIQAQPLDGFS